MLQGHQKGTTLFWGVPYPLYCGDTLLLNWWLCGEWPHAIKSTLASSGVHIFPSGTRSERLAPCTRAWARESTKRVPRTPCSPANLSCFSCVCCFVFFFFVFFCGKLSEKPRWRFDKGINPGVSASPQQSSDGKRIDPRAARAQDLPLQVGASLGSHGARG